MAVENPVITKPPIVRPRANYLSPKVIFNVAGWAILLLIVWLVVIPSVTKGIWEPFARDTTWRFLWDGLFITIQVAIYSMILSMIIGIVLALGRLSNQKIISVPSVLYIEFMRALPAFLVIFFVFIGLPKLGIRLDAIWFAVIGLTLYNSSVLAEVVRAGILSVEKGQLEAAYSLGLNPVATLRTIVLPQALRRMVPSIVSQLITITKDTSLAYIIGLQELTRKGQQFFQSTGNVLETMFVVGLIYFLICYLLSFVSSKLEVKRLR